LRLNLNYLPLGDYYWRVKTRIPNAGDTWSKVQKVTLSLEDAVEDILTETTQPGKRFQDGLIYIDHAGKTYNLLGNVIE
jgi:hypothetical protein